MNTPWFRVRPGYSVVIVDEVTEHSRVFFNTQKIVSRASSISLFDEYGNVVYFPTGRYRLASIKRQSCAEES